MGDDGDAAGLVDHLDRLLRGRPAAGDEGLGSRHQVLLEERPEVAAGAGRPGDVGAADRERVAGLADGVLEVQVEALAAQLLDDLAGAGDALVLGALAGAGDLAEVDPVAADVEVFGVLVHAGHLDRGDQLDPESLGGRAPHRRRRRSRRGR